MLKKDTEKILCRSQAIQIKERTLAFEGDAHTCSVEYCRGAKELKLRLNSQVFQANEAFLAEFLPQ